MVIMTNAEKELLKGAGKGLFVGVLTALLTNAVTKDAGASYVAGVTSFGFTVLIDAFTS